MSTCRSHGNNAEAALSRLATCAMQASDALPRAGRRHRGGDSSDRDNRGCAARRAEGPRPRLRRKRELLGRRTGPATADSAIGECWSGAIDVEAVIAIGIAAETWAEANEMSRCPVPATAERGPAAGLILRTLADHRRFELIACCTACERYVALEHAALAARFGWDAPLDVLRRRMTCRHRGARTGSVLISQARRPDAGGMEPPADKEGARMTEREGSDPEVQARFGWRKGRSSTRRIGELFRTGRPSRRRRWTRWPNGTSTSRTKRAASRRCSEGEGARTGRPPADRLADHQGAEGRDRVFNEGDRWISLVGEPRS